MKHIVISEASRPGMSLDQLAQAVEQARRSGATGTEIVRGRLFGRRRGLRSITVDLEEPVIPSGSTAASTRTRNRRTKAKDDAAKDDASQPKDTSQTKSVPA